jgi:putative CocE/NonD family hydrolase
MSLIFLAAVFAGACELPRDARLAVGFSSEESGVQPAWKNPMDRMPKSRWEMSWVLGRSEDPGPDFAATFDQQIVRIPMRDGVELHTEVYTPKDASEPLPIILTRWPYGLYPTADGYTAMLRLYPDLIEEGFIFAFQDTRGRGDSDGEYISLSPLRDRSDPDATDESTDAYDTIEWLVNYIPGSNGRVGTLGISYGGFLTTRALVDPHPALRAASPQSTCADMFIGDDWHHNGAFRLEYAFSWIAGMERDMNRNRTLGAYDLYESFLSLGPLGNVNKNIFHGQAPSWNAFTEHPNLDEYWTHEMCGVLPHIQEVTVPTLNVTGWFDAEDFYGPIQVYRKYESLDEQGINHLVVGPWYHGGWSFGSGKLLGAIAFGTDPSAYYRKEIQAPFFSYWLKDRGEFRLPEVLSFRTGDNVWEEHEEWPPTEGIERRNLYLHADGRLSFDAPEVAGPEARDVYVSDPAKPVPYRHRPIRTDGWPEWQLEDQRLADGRPDVLTYRSEPLTEDLTITGEPMANLFAATTGSDSDWIVKLIDVYPEEYGPEPYMGGFQFLVAGEVFRGRYRNSFERPEPVTPGQPTPYVFSLRSRNHTFKAGHSIMVQIQSTWFPLIDRNPQTYVDNIYEATAEDFQKATQSVFRSRDLPSNVSLPVVVR